MNSASYEYRKMSAKRRAQFVPIGIPTVCWKTFPAKPMKILSIRNSSILIMSSSEYLFFESECFLTKYVSSCPDTNYVSTVTVFENKGLSDNILVSLFFNFWWGMVAWSVDKSKELMLVTWLKVGDLNNSLEFLRIHIWLIPLLELAVSYCILNGQITSLNFTI